LAKDPSLLLLKALLLWGNYSAGSYHSGTEVRRVERTFEKKNPRIAYCSTAPSPRYCSLHWGCQDEALLTTPECSPILPGTKVLSSLLYCPSTLARDEALLTALLPQHSCQGRGSPHCYYCPSNPARDEALLTATTAPAILPGTRLSSLLLLPQQSCQGRGSPHCSTGPAMLGAGNALLTTPVAPTALRADMALLTTLLPQHSWGQSWLSLLLQSAPNETGTTFSLHRAHLVRRDCEGAIPSGTEALRAGRTFIKKKV